MHVVFWYRASLNLRLLFLPLTFAFACWTSSSVGNGTIDRHKGGIPLKSNEPCLTAQNQAHAQTTNHTYTLCWQILIWWFSSQPLICQIKVTANISSHTVTIRTNLCGQRKCHQTTTLTNPFMVLELRCEWQLSHTKDPYPSYAIVRTLLFSWARHCWTVMDQCYQACGSVLPSLWITLRSSDVT